MGLSKFKITISIILLLIFSWWVYMSPPNDVIIETYTFKEFTLEQDKIDALDSIKEQSEKYSALPGQDDIVFDKQGKWAYVSTLDGKLWQVNIATGEASVFVDVPLMPAGLRLSPTDENILYFCASRYYQQEYPENEVVGLYQINLTTKVVIALITQVPSNEKYEQIPDNETVYPLQIRQWHHNNKSSVQRPLAFCNDLDISQDGKRIYFSEPFSYEGASMGGGAFYEAVSLGRNGKLWVYDIEQNTISLVAHGFNFIDGVLLEYDQTEIDSMETSVLITETTKFSISRLHLSEQMPQYEDLWTSLPYMPDGLDRDAQGRIWTGMIKQRSEFMNRLHQKRWIKHLVMRIPRDWIPVSHSAAIMGFSEDASKIVYYSEHDGSLVPEISTVVPYQDKLYLPSFNQSQQSLYRIDMPELIKDTKLLKDKTAQDLP